MALDANTASQYFRSALQQQQLFAFWLAAGDTARAELCMDVVNWYYQQLGLPLYQPTSDPSYTPNPTDPATADQLAAALPLLTAGDSTGAAAAGAAGAGSVIGAGYQDLTRTAGGIGDTGSGSGNAAILQGNAPGALDSGVLPQDLDEYCAIYPDDPLCWAGGGESGGDGGDGPPVIVTINPTTVIIDQSGLTLGDVASRISGALASAAAAIAGAVDAALASALAGVQGALNALGNALQSVFSALARLAGLILKFLQGLLLDIVHGLVAAVEAIGKMLKDVFTNVIMPALQALQQLRNYLIQIYQRFLRPLLIWLQDVRRVLAILKAFHIGFATKLDNAIADIQAKISGPLLFVLGYVNAVANFINLILDARLFIQRPLFLASLNAYKGSALTLGINAMNPTPDPAALAALQATPAVPTPAHSATATTQLLTAGTGDYAAIVTEQSSALDALWAQGFE